MAEKLGYDKEGNIVFYNEKGEVVGELYDAITDKIAHSKEAKQLAEYLEEERKRIFGTDKDDKK